MIGVVETVTPERARELLEHNRCGRPLDPDIVKMMARAMRRGRWSPDIQGMSIRFDAEGYVVQGQTLLAAVVEADATLEMVMEPRFV